MRKFGLIVLIVIVVGAAAAAVIIFNPFSKKTYSVETVLPEGPLVFVSMNNVEKNIHKFRSTKFWQKAGSLNYPVILELLGSKKEEIVMYKGLQEQLLSPENQQILSSFFGQEIGVGIYPMEFNGLDPAAFQEMTTNVFFVTRLKPKAKFAEFVSGFMARISPDVQIKPVKYKNYTIMMAAGKAEDSLTIGYVSFGDLLVFGVGDKAAKTCIDVVTKTQKKLAEDAMYLQTKGDFLPGAQTTSFINFEKFTSLLKDQMLKMDMHTDDEAAKAANQQQFDDAFKQMQGFQSIGYSTKYDDFIKFKIDVHMDKAKLDPSVAENYNCQPAANESLAFVPLKAVGYQWNNCLNLKQYWRQMKNEIAESAKLEPQATPSADMISGMEQSLGLSIENDILPAIGNEFGGALTDIKITDAFPIPQLLFFIETADRDKADNVITKLLAKEPMLQLQTETYQDSTIKYVTVPMLVTSLEPAYAYLGKYFVLSTDRQLLKDAMEALKDPSKSLTANPKLKEIDLNLAGASNSTLFVDVEKLMQKTRGLVDWTNKWSVNEETKREAFKTGSQKRLTDLQNEIKTQEAELEELKGKLSAAQAAPVSDGPPDAASATAALNGEIEKKEADLDGSREKVVELTGLIDQYSQPIDVKGDKRILEELVRPLIQAFEFWRVLGSTTKLQPNLIETMVNLKVE